MDIHLDLVGGMAGDMFIAAMVDALPDHETDVVANIRLLYEICPVIADVVPHQDAILKGRMFNVRRAEPGFAVGMLPNASLADYQGSGASVHVHQSWQSIRAALESSSLPSGVKRHAIGIFSLLAQAEATVHGTDVNSVTFHEVGAWDSIADIVGAAALIDAVQARSWSMSPAPLGSGRVRTAHGMLPIPAPATAHLLLGMPTLDDGVAGERVTPTGAAILRYLCPPGVHDETRAALTRTLHATGIGFGTRRLPGLSNHVRVLCFDSIRSRRSATREIHVLEFEIDDQSGEDLATGLDRLRSHGAVLDVTQTPVFGKKGRMMSHVRVLVRPLHLDAAIEACFRETTTIGLRHRLVEGVCLHREIREVQVEGHEVKVKVVERPGGRTAKAESDDVSTSGDHSRRMSLRERAEDRALQAPPVAVDA